MGLCESHRGQTLGCYCSGSAIRKVPPGAAMVVEIGCFRPSLVRVTGTLSVSIHEKTQLSPSQGWDLAGESLACVFQGPRGMCILLQAQDQQVNEICYIQRML